MTFSLVNLTLVLVFPALLSSVSHMANSPPITFTLAHSQIRWTTYSYVLCQLLADSTSDTVFVTSIGQGWGETAHIAMWFLHHDGLWHVVLKLLVVAAAWARRTDQISRSGKVLYNFCSLWSRSRGVQYKMVWTDCTGLWANKYVLFLSDHVPSIHPDLEKRSPLAAMMS